MSDTKEVNDGVLVGAQGIPPVEEEVTDLVLGQGISPVEDFLFLKRFKTPVENDDNVCHGLVNDMLSFCTDQSQSIELRSRDNNQNCFMLTIPRRISQSMLGNLNVAVGHAIDWTSNDTDNGDLEVLVLERKSIL